jgi:prepilin-type N-terminal cleavage/methylation domain-containing protein
MINKKTQAFTLIELSIVISIIGFLIVGVVSINALFKHSIILTTIKDLQTYISAVNNFSSIYGNLPGDIDNATMVFGSTDKNGNTINNGNGDGLIGSPSTIGLIANQEVYSAFQELSLLQLIKGNFNGSATTANPGINLPLSSYGNKSIYYINTSNLGVYSNFNSLVLSGASNAGWNNYVVKVSDAYGIDVKIDDGIPLTGNIISYNANASNCTSSTISSATTSTLRTSISYLLNSSTFCTLHMSLESYGFK